MTPEQKLISAGRLRIVDLGKNWRKAIEGGSPGRWEKAHNQLVLIHRFYHTLNGFRELHATQSPSIFLVEAKLAKIYDQLKEIDFEKSFSAMMCPLLDAVEHGDVYACYDFYRN